MVGQYVRIVVAPARMGTVLAARYDRGHISYLFHLDPRLSNKLPDAWIPESDMEECSRPTDEEVVAINLKGKKNGSR